MISVFWQAQMDYVFFVYGIAFLLLGAVIWGVSKPSWSRLPWNYLAWFGFLHGANEWFDMLAVSLGDSPDFKWVRLIIMAVSFLPLVEFGRAGLKAQGISVPGQWIYIPLVALSGCGYLAGMSGLNAGCRYALGFTGGLLAGIVFLREPPRAEASPRWSLRLIGWAFLIYGFAAGLIVPKAGFFPANILNNDAFLNITGFPIQVARALCAVSAALGAWFIFGYKYDKDKGTYEWQSWFVPFALAVTLVAGFWVVNWRGQVADQEQRDRLSSQVIDIARTISSNRVNMLSFSDEDKHNPSYVRLRNQMVAYGQAMGLRSIYSMAVRGDHIVFGPESIPESSPLASAPGTIYQKPRPEDWEAFKTGKPYTVGPVADEYGTFVSAGAPVRDPHTGKIILMIGADIDATIFQTTVVRARIMALFSILIVVCIILFTLSILGWRNQLSKEQRNKLRYIEVWLTVVIGIIATVNAVYFIRDEEQRYRKAVFIQLARAQTGDIVQAFVSMRDYELGGLARFFDGSEQVEFREFQAFAGPQVRTSLVRAWEWIPAVPAEMRTEFEEGVHRQGLSDFTIFEKNADGVNIVPPERLFYYPVQYIEPFAGNEKILGYDVGSEPLRRSALEESARVGFATATEPVTLTHEMGGQKAIVVFHPVFKHVPLDFGYDVDIDTNSLQGFAAVVVNLGDMLKKTIFDSGVRTALLGPADVNLYQLKKDDTPLWIASSKTDDDQRHADKNKALLDLADTRNYVSPLFMFGKTYALVIHPKPGSIDAPVASSIFFGFIGIILTGALAYSLFSALSRAAKVEALVAEKTEELKSKELQLGAIVSNVPGAIYRCVNDVHWTMEFISSEIENISGYPVSDFIKNKVRSYASIIYPDDVTLVDRTIQDAISKEESYIIEYRIVHSSGKIRWVFEKGQPIFIGDGKLAWLDGVISDVSERRKSEEQLRHLSRAVEQSPAVVVITDRDGKIEYANPKFVQLTGYTLREAVGQNPRILKGGTESAEFYKQLWNTILAGNEWRGEFLNKKKNGELYWESASISPLKNNRGEITHFVAVKEDITERKKLERIKDDFTSTVSHELRTPLAAMKEGIGIVLDGTAGEISPEQKEFLGLAKRNVDRLGRLINDVLDFQKLDSGAMTFKIRDEDINSVIRDVGQMMMLAVAKQKGLDLNFNLGENLPRIPFDRDKIIQVLTNLINNAIKFTDKGSITVTSSLGDNAVEVSVRDTGIGIKEEDLPKLFGKFTQLTSGSDRKTGGTGLGLAISKQIVEWHKGKIWAESKFGEGTTIRFFLPIGERRT